MNDLQFVYAMFLGAGILFLVWAAYKALLKVGEKYPNVSVPAIIDQAIGKALISFDTTSDQGLIRDFQYAGVIVGRCVDEDNWRSKYYSHEFFYKVKIIISHCDRVKVGEIKEVPAWYCDKSKEIIIHTD